MQHEARERGDWVAPDDSIDEGFERMFGKVDVRYVRAGSSPAPYTSLINGSLIAVCVRVSCAARTTRRTTKTRCRPRTRRSSSRTRTTPCARTSTCLVSSAASSCLRAPWLTLLVFARAD